MSHEHREQSEQAREHNSTMCCYQRTNRQQQELQAAQPSTAPYPKGIPKLTEAVISILLVGRPVHPTFPQGLRGRIASSTLEPAMCGGLSRGKIRLGGTVR